MNNQLSHHYQIELYKHTTHQFELHLLLKPKINNIINIIIQVLITETTRFALVSL